MKYYAVSNDFGEKKSGSCFVFCFFKYLSQPLKCQNILNTEATQIMRGTL